MARPPRAQQSPGRHERGVALFVVMVMVMMTTLLVLWTSRTALISEMVTGNDSDYQRALEAAHAMLRDAQLDIQGERPDGSPCASGAGFGGCRSWSPVFDIPGKKVFFPTSEQEFQDLRNLLAAELPSCAMGICVPDQVAPLFWQDSARLLAMQDKGAAYGEYTGADPSVAGNPILLHQKKRAWYWIELLPYDPSAAIANGGLAGALAPDAATPYVYRITALAQGLRPNTQAVVQTVFVWKSLKS